MDKREFAANLKVFIPKLKRFCLKKGYGILVSTSKRTPPEIDRYIEEKFKGFSQTQALVIFNRENYDFVFEGFSALADITFVTSESISMVSEAASFNKVCVCVFLEIEDDKRRVFLETVKQEVVFLRRPFSIENTELKPSSIWDRNRKIIKEAIGALLK